jgi:hypothetical protein
LPNDDDNEPPFMHDDRCLHLSLPPNIHLPTVFHLFTDTASS